MCIKYWKNIKMQLIGITGLIGSGKTTVGQILRELGFVVFDMDVWCRKMYFDKEFLKRIKELFPQTFYNNTFNKRKLRNLVFSNSDELKKLESLVHPYLIEKILKNIHHFRFNPHLFFIETALLYKMRLDKYCSSVIITKAPYDVMKERVMKRDLIDGEGFENIIKNQDIFINNFSPYVIDTNQPLTILKADIIKLIEGL